MSCYFRLLEVSKSIVFVPKTRPLLDPVLASVELLVDDEDDVLSKFGGTLVPTISL